MLGRVRHLGGSLGVGLGLRTSAPRVTIGVKSTFLYLTVAAVSTHLFFLYRIPSGLPLSITVDRLLLLIAGIVFLAYIVKKRKALGAPLALAGLISASVTISLLGGFGGPYPSRGLLTFVCISYFVVTCYAVYISKPGLRWLIFSHVFLGYVLIAFLVYFYGNRFISGTFPLHPPFHDALPFFSVAEPDLTAGTSAFRRAQLPFARPHDFGLAAALSFLMIRWGIIRGDLRSANKFTYGLLTGLVIGIILSGSRSAIAPFFLVVGMLLARTLAGWLFVRMRIPHPRRLLRGALGITVLIAPVVLLGVWSWSLLGSHVVERVLFSGYGAHTELRLTGLDAFGRMGWWERLVGVGPEGFRPFLGEQGRGSPHATYLTVLIELGMVGTLAFGAMVATVVWRLSKLHHMIARDERAIVWGIVTMILIANALYDFQVTTIQWIGMGMILGFTYRTEGRDGWHGGVVACSNGEGGRNSPSSGRWASQSVGGMGG